MTISISIVGESWEINTPLAALALAFAALSSQFEDLANDENLEGALSYPISLEVEQTFSKFRLLIFRDCP